MPFVIIVHHSAVHRARGGVGRRFVSLGCVRLKSGAALLNVMDASEAAVKRLGFAGAEEEKIGGLEEEEEEEHSESEPDDAEVSTMPGMTEAADISIAESLPNTDDGEAPFTGLFTQKCPDNSDCASAFSIRLAEQNANNMNTCFV